MADFEATLRELDQKIMRMQQTIARLQEDHANPPTQEVREARLQQETDDLNNLVAEHDALTIAMQTITLGQIEGAGQ
ncbi:hypothetical protein A2U01_0026976 [Trifolium medium]|uniref:Uncharacterized protein n=1 Tax=Trifolium medium TaxID=97028 RepID=A0A392P1J4_9FABA|nr:hypothetical protein [Trifolium medium]